MRLVCEFNLQLSGTECKSLDMRVSLPAIAVGNRSHNTEGILRLWERILFAKRGAAADLDIGAHP